MYLAGDIGGTKTVLGLFTRESGPHRPLVEGRYPSSEFDSLAQILGNFLNQHQVTPKAASSSGFARLT